MRCPWKLHIFCCGLYGVFVAFGPLVARARFHILTRLEHYIFSVVAYVEILRFRAYNGQEPGIYALTRHRKLYILYCGTEILRFLDSGGQGPRTNVLRRPREPYILCYGFWGDSSNSGLWWPGAQNLCFDAPSETVLFWLCLIAQFLLSFIRRCVGFGPVVARGPASML